MSETPNAAASSCPGKVIVCGEYAVLFGAKAIVAAAGPRFTLRVNRRPASGTGADAPIVLGTPEGGSVRVRGIPPGSPAARWMEVWVERACLRDLLELDFEDPLAGTGGFGASTAQFALVARALGGERDWAQVWREYRALHSGEALPPSGADLALQLLASTGGWGAIAFSVEGPGAERAELRFDGASLLVFSATGQAGRKVRTHEHLRALGRAGLLAVIEPAMARLESALASALEASRVRDGAAFGAALTAYAAALAEVGLESPEAAADRAALGAVDGVLGVKGTGAMLADGVLVACRAGAEGRVREAAAARGLRAMEWSA